METAKKFEYPENFIKYLGTSGGRFSMIRQLRSTGGLWFRYGGVQGVIDPGPGSLAHICAARPALEIASADVVMLTHKHIDHSTDVNVVIEGMTHGGFDSRGMLVAPDDALRGNDPVVLKYSQKRIPKIKIPEEGGKIELGDGVMVEPVIHLHHGVDCFGYIFRKEGLREWGIISDSRMMPYFRSRYSACAFISINATFPDRKPRLDHISIAEARELLSKIHPKLAVLTHLGAMLTSGDGAHFLENLDLPETKLRAATDGMVVDLDSLTLYKECLTPRNAEYAEE